MSQSKRLFFVNFFKDIDLDVMYQICFAALEGSHKRDKVPVLKAQGERFELTNLLIEHYLKPVDRSRELIDFCKKFFDGFYSGEPDIASAVQEKLNSLDVKDYSEQTKQSQSHVDVLIITAAPGEQEALFKCIDFLAESPQNAKNSWERKSHLKLDYYQKRFTYKDGRKITVASVNTLEYGVISATNTATGFASLLKPNCLAIVGICAGYRKEVSLGDVIVAEKLFQANSGNSFSEVKTYQLKSDWYQQVKNYNEGLNNIDWSYLNIERPKSYEYQSHWLLHTLFEHQTLNGASPENHPDWEKKCPDFGEVVEFLEKDGLLKWNSDADLVLTEQALTKVKIEKRKNILVKEPEFPRIWFRPVATGSQLLEDDDAFERIRKEQEQRYTCGYDMEGYSVAESAWFNDLERMIFVKAVSDYGDSQRGRNGHFRSYACKAAATFLIHFLKEHYFS